jgi:alpha-L-fucosidase
MFSRRDFLLSAGAALLAPRAVSGRAARPRPTKSQLDWQRDELAIFLHFGVNTFTDREWGDGTEDPAIFLPTDLDARQWTRVARDAGARALILTAKHHDGFCLWPTKTTSHSVASSGWRGGQGDVVRELVDACRADGLGVGLYLSPWDRHEPAYGDSPRYNDFYCAQLTELLTGYGPLREVWFDGANGEGPNGRHQVYDWPRIWALVRRHQPGAVMFSDAGPDVRWIGNERGLAAETNWSTVDPAVVPYPGASGDAVIEMLQHGDPRGTVWRPGETDVSIRPGWFYHPAEDDRVRSSDDLVELYFTSVGRNSKLLLNVPPTRAGRLHERDAANLLAARQRLTNLLADDLAARGTSRWRSTGHRTAILDIVLGTPRTIAIADLREDVTQGQAVARYTLTGSNGGPWQPLASGTTIGFRRLARFTPTAVRRIRLSVDEAVAPPTRVTLGLYAGE